MYQSNLRDEVLMSLRKIKNNVETAESPKVDMWCHLGTSFIRAPGEGSVHFSLSLMNIGPSIKSPSCLKAVFFLLRCLFVVVLLAVSPSCAR